MRQLEPVLRDSRPSEANAPETVPQIPISPISGASGRPPAPLGQKRDSSGMLEYWLMIRRHQVAVVLVALAGAIVGFCMTLSAPRMYQAHATIEIQGLNDNFLNMKELNPNDTGGSSYSDTDIQTQVKILQSTTLIRSVTAKMVEPPDAEMILVPDRLSAWRKALGITPP